MTHIAWSTLGGFTGIFAIERIGYLLGLSGYGYLFLIGSFGASPVLAYGIPQAEFSQPHNLIGVMLFPLWLEYAYFKFWEPIR